jgi:hypothetical protein
MTINFDDATLASIRALANEGRIVTPSLIVVALIDELRETRAELARALADNERQAARRDERQMWIEL